MSLEWLGFDSSSLHPSISKSIPYACWFKSSSHLEIVDMVSKPALFSAFLPLWLPSTYSTYVLPILQNWHLCHASEAWHCHMHFLFPPKWLVSPLSPWNMIDSEQWNASFLQPSLIVALSHHLSQFRASIPKLQVAFHKLWGTHTTPWTVLLFSGHSEMNFFHSHMHGFTISLVDSPGSSAPLQLVCSTLHILLTPFPSNIHTMWHLFNVQCSPYLYSPTHWFPPYPLGITPICFLTHWSPP